MAEKENTKIKEREFIVECIQLYRELSSLWNVKSKEYHDRDKKNADYETLLSKYKEMFPQASKDDVKKKFNSLRTNYRKELKKYLQSMKSGSSTDDIYQPTLWYFSEMVFLQDQESASDSQSSMDTQSTLRSPGGESERSSLDNNYTQENSSTVEADQVPSTSHAVPKTKDKKIKRKPEDDLMQLAAKRLREKPDEYENWALSCAADLKKMEPMQQIFAKSAIAAIIMEGQLGSLHRNSVKINTPTVTITPSPTYTRSTPTPTYNNNNYSSTPSPRYYINYSQQQNSELPPEQLPHNQQNMYYFQQDNQQTMNNSQQENDANDSISQYIKLNN